MSSHEYQEQSLEEFDAAEREELERAEASVLQVFTDQHPTTTSELSKLVRAELGDVDNSVIRAAILRLLNENKLDIDNGRAVAAQ
jgi:uncharacterized protein YqeY